MKFASWLTDSLHRLQPHTMPARAAGMSMPAARGEKLSCQLAVRVTGGNMPVKVSLAAQADEGLSVRIRRAGYVPVPHVNTDAVPGHVEGRLPGYVPDPLFDENTVQAWMDETNTFWLSIAVDPACRPGKRKVRLEVAFADQAVQKHELTIDVRPVTLQPRRDFSVTHWFYNDALLDWYKLSAFEPAYWAIVEKYIADVVAHGQDCLLVPVITPPLDGVKRPTQLLKVARSGRKYSFDFSDVRRYVRLAGRCGISKMEWCHLFTQWGVKFAPRIYHGQGHGQGQDEQRLLWSPETPATGKVYRDFLGQFLPQLRQFIVREKLAERSLFHLSDEPQGQETRANYAAARAMLAELAPWMKVMDAMSEIEFARQGLIDMPVPITASTGQFVCDGIPCWTYYCCDPRGKGLNRLMDTPLGKIRMSGWLFHRWGVKGFLHWGYNYWYAHKTRNMIDPCRTLDALTLPSGDAFMVYPGPDGPVDSLRWEVFAESLQDLALLQTLGVPRDSRLLAPIRDHDDMPFRPEWIKQARRKLLM